MDSCGRTTTVRLYCTLQCDCGKSLPISSVLTFRPFSLPILPSFRSRLLSKHIFYIEPLLLRKFCTFCTHRFSVHNLAFLKIYLSVFRLNVFSKVIVSVRAYLQHPKSGRGKFTLPLIASFLVIVISYLLQSHAKHSSLCFITVLFHVACTHCYSSLFLNARTCRYPGGLGQTSPILRGGKCYGVLIM